MIFAKVLIFCAFSKLTATDLITVPAMSSAGISNLELLIASVVASIFLSCLLFIDSIVRVIPAAAIPYKNPVVISREGMVGKFLSDLTGFLLIITDL